jgi:hypothetical protein
VYAVALGVPPVTPARTTSCGSVPAIGGRRLGRACREPVGRSRSSCRVTQATDDSAAGPPSSLLTLEDGVDIYESNEGILRELMRATFSDSGFRPYRRCSRTSPILFGSLPCLRMSGARSTKVNVPNWGRSAARPRFLLHSEIGAGVRDDSLRYAGGTAQAAVRSVSTEKRTPRGS